MIEKLPHKIRYEKRKSYGVSMVSGFNDPTQEGECCPNTKQIKIKAGLGDKKTVSVLLHEHIHLLNFVNNLGLTESQVEGLELGFIKSLELNQDYLRLLHKTFLKPKRGRLNAK